MVELYERFAVGVAQIKSFTQEESPSQCLQILMHLGQLLLHVGLLDRGNQHIESLQDNLLVLECQESGHSVDRIKDGLSMGSFYQVDQKSKHNHHCFLIKILAVNLFLKQLVKEVEHLYPEVEVSVRHFNPFGLVLEFREDGQYGGVVKFFLDAIDQNLV